MSKAVRPDWYRQVAKSSGALFGPSQGWSAPSARALGVETTSKRANDAATKRRLFFTGTSRFFFELTQPLFRRVQSGSKRLSCQLPMRDQCHEWHGVLKSHNCKLLH